MAGVLIGIGSSLLPLLESYGVKEGVSMIGKSIAIGTGSYAIKKAWEEHGKKKKRRSKKRKVTAKHYKKKRSRK